MNPVYAEWVAATGGGPNWEFIAWVCKISKSTNAKGLTMEPGKWVLCHNDRMDWPNVKNGEKYQVEAVSDDGRLLINGSWMPKQCFYACSEPLRAILLTDGQDDQATLDAAKRFLPGVVFESRIVEHADRGSYVAGHNGYFVRNLDDVKRADRLQRVAMLSESDIAEECW